MNILTTDEREALNACTSLEEVLAIVELLQIEYDVPVINDMPAWMSAELATLDHADSNDPYFYANEVVSNVTDEI